MDFTHWYQTQNPEHIDEISALAGWEARDSPVAILLEGLDMFDVKGNFITGNRPGDFQKWLIRARVVVDR